MTQYAVLTYDPELERLGEPPWLVATGPLSREDAEEAHREALESFAGEPAVSGVQVHVARWEPQPRRPPARFYATS